MLCYKQFISFNFFILQENNLNWYYQKTFFRNNSEEDTGYFSHKI